MATISEESKKALENSLGLPYEQLCGMDIHEEIAFVVSKTGKRPHFIHDPRKISRGNPLLALGKVITMEEINKKIDALHKWGVLLATAEERIRDIYKTYIEVICPYIICYETLSDRFPVEILNEIRSVFTHLSKYNLSDNISIKERNLSKAEDHIKRSILDCYKFICTAYEDEYSKFDKRYKNTDLSFVDNGEFLPKLLEARKKAKDLLFEARKTDLSLDSDDEINTDKAYEKYEKAFFAYTSVYNLINDSYKKLENIRKKAITRNTISIAIGIIGLIIGILGIILK